MKNKIKNQLTQQGFTQLSGQAGDSIVKMCQAIEAGVFNMSTTQPNRKGLVSDNESLLKDMTISQVLEIMKNARTK